MEALEMDGNRSAHNPYNRYKTKTLLCELFDCDHILFTLAADSELDFRQFPSPVVRDD
jgi:hypothetical protein